MSWRQVSDGSVPDLSFERLWAERQQKVTRLMEDQGLDVLVGVAGGAKGQRGVVRYLSNYATNSQWSCLLWAHGRAPRLILAYFGFISDAEAMTWISDIQADPDLPGAVARYLSEQGATRGKVGWAGPPVLVQAIRSGVETLAVQATHVSVQNAVAEMAASKTPEELRLVRRVAAIGDAILQKVQEQVRPGITDRDLVAAAEYTGRRLGTTSGGSIEMSRGTGMAGPVLLDKPLEAGDVVQFSVEPEGPGGYWIQTVRMYALGEPSKELKQWIQKGLEAEQRAEALLKSGCSVSEVAQTMLAATGQSESDLPFQLGHGIGLDMAEPPRISSANTDTLKENMTVVIHPSARDEHAAIFFGDTFVVHKDGSEQLSRLARDLVVVE